MLPGCLLISRPRRRPHPPWCRQHCLEGLLGLGDEELQDAWVLLEPRPEPEEEAEEQAGGPTRAAAAAVAAAPAAVAGGGWRTKRSGPAALPEPPLKRQQAGEAGSAARGF